MSLSLRKIMCKNRFIHKNMLQLDCYNFFEVLNIS